MCYGALLVKKKAIGIIKNKEVYVGVANTQKWKLISHRLCPPLLQNAVVCVKAIL